MKWTGHQLPRAFEGRKSRGLLRHCGNPGSRLTFANNTRINIDVNITRIDIGRCGHLDFPEPGWHDQSHNKPGVPYEIARYQRQPDMRAPKELRAIHPLGKSPVITDNGNTVAESGAIVEYIIATYGNGRLIPPPNTPERLRYTYWLHYAEGSAMPPLLLKLLFSLMPKRAPALLRPLVRKVSNQALTTLVNPQLKQHMAYWEAELGKSEWFAGNEFSAADIQMSFPLEAASARAGLEDGHPKAMAWLERIHARPAYARALEKGGPYMVGR
jgi:glutathione S-transferase